MRMAGWPTVRAFLEDLGRRYPSARFRIRKDLIWCKMEGDRRWRIVRERERATGSPGEFHHLMEAAIHDHDSHEPGAYVILEGGQMLVTPRRLTALRAFHEGHACRDCAREEWFSPKPGETAFDLLKKVKSPLTRQEIEVIATFARRTGRDIMTMVDTDEEERAAYRNGAERVWVRWYRSVLSSTPGVLSNAGGSGSPLQAGGSSWPCDAVAS